MISIHTSRGVFDGLYHHVFGFFGPEAFYAYRKGLHYRIAGSCGYFLAVVDDFGNLVKVEG